jgi:hypothetical protein
MRGFLWYLGMLAGAMLCMQMLMPWHKQLSEAELHKNRMDGCFQAAAITGNDADLCLIDPLAATHVFLFGG